LIGLSPGYVKAGALVAVHTTATQYAADLMEMSRNILNHANSPLPEPRHPGRFTVDINDRVAHSLSIPLADPHELERALQITERSQP